jgi:hypothetical protein
MRKVFICCMFLFLANNISAQKRIFDCQLSNDDYQVFIKMNLYEQNISIPGQEIFGKLAGYFGSKRSVMIWPIVKAKVENDSVATIQLINDLGSEDLSCTLSFQKDGSYLLHQDDGSTLKIVVNSKYVKIPKTLKLYRKENK